MALEGDGTGAANVKEGVVISQGAAVALGHALSRVIPANVSEPDRKSFKKKGKRPRSLTDTKDPRRPVVLAENEDVLKAVSEEHEQKKRHKKHKKQKLLFEQNAHVIPDAATGAALEKSFLTIATKGTVALFNAVAKAQKVSNRRRTVTEKQKGPPVTKKAFMDMMKANIEKSVAMPLPSANKEGHQSNSDGDTQKQTRLKAKWLKEDFLTSKAKKLKDWDRAEEEAESSDSESDVDSASISEEDDLDINEEGEEEMEEDDVFSEESEMEEEYE